jgi:carboxyl-terminal processing protease
MSDSTTLTKFQIRLPLLIGLAVAIGMFAGQQLPHPATHLSFGNANRSALGQSLDEILQYVDARYVDTLDVNRLKNTTIEHLLKQLDPHSVYISPEEAQAAADDMSGGFEGVGIEFIMLDDTIQIVSPIAGGPSEQAGILAGDKLVTINDSVVAGVKIANGMIYKKLRGPKGSQVRLGVLRGREQSLRQFTISRDVISVKSVEVVYLLDAQTGYVKINRFTAKTYTEFMEAIRPLVEEQGMQNLLLDLRGNPGGYLEEATQLLSQLFPEGKLLVYTQGRNNDRREYKSNGRARFNLNNVAVLIDEGSASASEIVAGAVQDNDRGWVVGRRSYGKGLVQEEYDLSDGGRLRLTIARYYTASGRCIQRAYKNTADYEKEESRRLASGELTDATKIAVADTTKYFTGMGRVVYGGGGITPDVFIPLDTSYFNPYFDGLNAHLAQFTARWWERQDRKQLPTDVADFVKNYTVSEALLTELRTYAEKQGLKPNATHWLRCQAEIKTRLKARIGRLLFGDEAEFRVLNDDDPAVEKALQLIQTNAALPKN